MTERVRPAARASSWRHFISSYTRSLLSPTLSPPPPQSLVMPLSLKVPFYPSSPVTAGVHCLAEVEASSLKMCAAILNYTAFRELHMLPPETCAQLTSLSPVQQGKVLSPLFNLPRNSTRRGLGNTGTNWAEARLWK